MHSYIVLKTSLPGYIFDIYRYGIHSVTTVLYCTVLYCTGT